MSKGVIAKSAVISAIEDTDTLDEAAEQLEINISELREICKAFYIDLSSVEDFSQTFYFTFGSAHITKDGVNLKDSWVRVIASDYDAARKVFIECFTSIYMESNDKWAFQYAAKDFEAAPEWFRDGEFLLIRQIT